METKGEKSNTMSKEDKFLQSLAKKEVSEFNEEMKSKKEEIKRANQNHRKTKQRLSEMAKKLKELGSLRRKLRAEIARLEANWPRKDYSSSSGSDADEYEMDF